MYHLRQTRKGVTTTYPIAGFQLYVVGLYVILENGQQLNLDRTKNRPYIYTEDGKHMGLQKFINRHCDKYCDKEELC